MNLAVRRLHRVNDFRSALVQHAMIVRFHSDADYFIRPSHKTPTKFDGLTTSSFGGSTKVSCGRLAVNSSLNHFGKFLISFEKNDLFSVVFPKACNPFLNGLTA
jgi:hypothetical protein